MTYIIYKKLYIIVITYIVGKRNDFIYSKRSACISLKYTLILYSFTITDRDVTLGCFSNRPSSFFPSTNMMYGVAILCYVVFKTQKTLVNETGT